VRLIVTNPVHLGQWATFVSTPTATAGRSVVRVQTTVVNQSGAAADLAVQVALIGPDGKEVAMAQTPAQTTAAGGSADFQQDLTVENPHLWNLESPSLYRAVTRVLAAGATLDEESTTFGIHEFRFDPATGFWLNGKNLKIKGVCLHHDGGALGAAVPLDAWERRLNLLKQMGCNAIRTAHNPAAPEFLDLCDRMGFLVMDEMFDCWTVAKNPFDYHLYFRQWSAIDTRDTVMHDRNHPSIVLYSAGNEIRDTPNAEVAIPLLKALVETFHKCDPTRPVTQGLFRPNVSHDYDNGLADLLDVVGTNYRDAELLAAQRAKPTRTIVGTENKTDRASWLAVRDNASYSGHFLWAGFDYLGEADWPATTEPEGLIDRTGRYKPTAYEHQAWWSAVPVVSVFRAEGRAGLYPNWTPRDASAGPAAVTVYSNCEQVELVLNGKSLGSQPLPADASPRTWSVGFEPGMLQAIGRNKNEIVARQELKTAGKAAKITLSADHAEISPTWDSVAYVTVNVMDENGVVCPWAADEVAFKLNGPGRIIGVDNGDRTSHESYQSPQRRLYEGQAIVIVRATGAGPITLTVSAAGLSEGTMTIQAR
jgi:beta-galactosidase